MSSVRAAAALPLAIVALAGLAAPAGPARAETYHTCAGFIDAVPTTIATQGVWCMRHDLGTAITTGAAITIAANNVTIDCNGFKLGGLAAGDATEAVGILADNRANAFVRNCNVRGFFRGTELTGSGHAVLDSRFDNNTYAGITVAGEGALVRGNRVSDTGGSTASAQISAYGIAVLTSYDGRIADNTVDTVFSLAGSVTGIQAGLLHGTVENNAVSVLRPGEGSTVRGIWVNYSPSRAMIRDNVIATNPAEAGTGVICGGAFARGNAVGRIDTAMSGCVDAGDNVSN